MSKKYTTEEIHHLKKLKIMGYSYSEIRNMTGSSYATICRWTKGIKHDEGLYFREKIPHNERISEQGRKNLIKSGLNAVKRNKKFWTKPEKLFKELLEECGISVLFPEYLKNELKILEEIDKNKPFVNFQYPIQRYVLDYVWIDKRICFNINGDYWHANPIIYDNKKLSKSQKHNIKQDENKKIFLKNNGWRIVNIWESDLKWRYEYIKTMIQGYLYENNKETYIYDTPDWSDALKSLWFKPKKIKSTKNLVKTCPTCGKEFDPGENNKKYCELECFYIKSRKFNVDKTELEILILIQKIPFTKLGKMYGVSDNAVRKKARSYGII